MLKYPIHFQSLDDPTHLNVYSIDTVKYLTQIVITNTAHRGKGVYDSGLLEIEII